MFRYVTAQATNRKKLELRLFNMSDVLIEHLCKIALHKEDRSTDVNGWIESVSSGLSRASKYEVKSSVDGEFYEMSLFASFPVSAIDAEAILEDWNEDLTKAGYDSVDEDYIHSISSNFYKVCSYLMIECINLFLSKERSKDMKFFNNLVRDAFYKNGFDLSK